MECFFPPTLMLFSDNEESVAIQKTNNIEHTNEDSKDSTNTTMSPFQIDLSSESGATRTTVNTIRDVISNNRSLFYFSVITGLVYPYSANPKLLWKYRLLRSWVLLLHVGYFVLLVTVFVAFILQAIVPTSSTTTLLLDIFMPATYIVQLVLLYITVMYVRRDMSRVRPELTQSHFQEAFVSAAQLNQRLLVLFLLSQIPVIIIQHIPFEQVVIIVMFFTAFLLCGATTFLMGTIRVIRQHLLLLQQRISAQSLRQTTYFHLRDMVNSRNDPISLNLLMIPAAIGTFATVVRIIAFASEPGGSASANQVGNVRNVVFISYMLLRESVVFLLVLYEIARTNEIFETFLPTLARDNWGMSNITASRGNDSLCPANESIASRTADIYSQSASNLEKADQQLEEAPLLQRQEIERLSLALAVEKYTIGARVFFFQPSRRTVFLQIASVIFSLVFAIVSKIVTAEVERHKQQ